VNLFRLHIFFVLTGSTLGQALGTELTASRSTQAQIEFEPKIDIPWIALGTMGSLSLIYFEDDLAPKHCRWCEPPPLDQSIRDQVRWSDTGLAHNLSHLSAYALIPASALSFSYLDFRTQKGNPNTPWIDAMLMIEAAGTAEVLAKSIQFISGRQRPSARSGDQQLLKPEDNTSFFSGHTSVAFAMAVAAGTYAEMTRSSLRFWTWGVGLSLATTTAYLRVASDHHYFTDVLVGAITGSIVGASVPRLRARFQASYQRDADLRLAPLPNGLAAELKW
jgi:membrane-associated phospholipid phosphatase